MPSSSVRVVPVADATRSAGLQSEADRQHDDVERLRLAVRQLHHQLVGRAGGHRADHGLEARRQAALACRDALPFGADLLGDLGSRSGMPIQHRQPRSWLERAGQRPIVDAGVEPTVGAAVLQPEGTRRGVEQDHLGGRLLERIGGSRQPGKARSHNRQGLFIEAAAHANERMNEIDRPALLRMDRDVAVERAEQIKPRQAPLHLAQEFLQLLVGGHGGSLDGAGECASGSTHNGRLSRRTADDRHRGGVGGAEP